ncbi:ABC transporter ATP-binding protein [Lactobacillus isalae]|uniref:ABC transporter ATP-binding protein n=1 Tax=Lactobacillus isalae TaxID=2993455 RepID=UPI0024A81200|nr:ATP-binding cassette domain-containing protein [Lactobacillus isalae]
MDELIEVHNIYKVFHTKNSDKTAINGISFTIKSGEIVGYIGMNGAGKSTMIKIMCGILTPSKGEVKIDGIIPYESRIRNAKNIGAVFGQRSQLWWDLPVIDSFKLLKSLYKISNREFARILNYFDDLFGISNLYNSLVRTLSLGERMKADIVASMLHNPKILFLDEPTIGLDFQAKNKMREAILDINKRYGTTIILTTHDLNDIETLCKRILIINSGKKIYDNSMEKLKTKYGNYKLLEFSNLTDCKFNKLISILNKNKISVSVAERNKVKEIILKKDQTNFAKVMEIIGEIDDSLNVELRNYPTEEIIERVYKDNETKK